MKTPLEGIIVALTSPFVGDEISPDNLQENIEKFNKIALSGYLILGSTGECVSLTDAESIELVEAVARSADSSKKILVGTARESTRATLAFTNRVAEYGIAAALVRSPSYYKSRMTRVALQRHFLTLADGAKIPLLVYNIPQNTGINLDPQLVVELANHPNIIGLKESSGNLGFLGEIIPQVPPYFRYFLGSGHVLFPGLEMGASGAILAVANAAPETCVEIYEAFIKGEKERAKKLQLDLIPLNKAVMQEYGLSGLKYAQDLRGYYGGPVRLPLLPIEEEGKKTIFDSLARLGLITA